MSVSEWSRRREEEEKQQKSILRLKRQLLDHPLRSRVVFEECFERYRDTQGGGTFKGLLKLQKKLFYPDYDHNLARGTALACDRTQGAPSRVTLAPGWRDSGRFRGSKVDRQVTSVVNCGLEATRRLGKLHPYTTAFFKALDTWRLAPIWSQYTVFDPEACIATDIDLICVCRRTGGYVVIELKCGFDKYYHNSLSQFHGVLEGVGDCALNQHHLQLYWGASALERTFGVPIEAAFVVQVHEGGVSRYPVPEWLVERGARTVSDLTEQRTSMTKFKNLSKEKKAARHVRKEAARIARTGLTQVQRRAKRKRENNPEKAIRKKTYKKINKRIKRLGGEGALIVDPEDQPLDYGLVDDGSCEPAPKLSSAKRKKKQSMEDLKRDLVRSGVPITDETVATMILDRD
jgi:hypothetical protein